MRSSYNTKVNIIITFDKF